MAKALQRETAALIAWISAASAGDGWSDPATRTGRRDAVISHSAWFKNSVRSREALGSQKAVAGDLGIGESTIQSYESGRADIPKSIELAIAELMRRKREAKPMKSFEDWEAEWATLHQIERGAFEKMMRNRPDTEYLIHPNPVTLLAVEKWNRYCVAWQQAKETVDAFMAEFRKNYKP